jgi:hypothetical protein
VPPDLRWTRLGSSLRVVAEAGFFAVVYAAAAVVIGHHPPHIGPIEFGLMVGFGLIVGSFARDSPELGAFVLIAAVLGGGLVGWLASPDARALLGTDLGGAVASHGIGWLGAFAVLRGSLIQGAASATGLEQLLRWLLPLAAVLWAVTTILAPAGLWQSFATFALWGSLAMIVAGLTAIGLVRLREVHENLADNRVRQMWRWLVIGAAVAVVPLAIPFVALSGVPIGEIFAPITGPLLLVVGLLLLPLALLVELLLDVIRPVFVGSGADPGAPADPIELFTADQLGLQNVGPTLAGTLLAVALVTLVTAVLLIAIYSLARWALRRDPYAETGDGRVPDVVEHVIVVPVAEPARPRSAARRRRTTAHDAVTAYVSAIEELAAHPIWGRAAVETPAEHSLRLRIAEMPGSADFARLAADYQLARYAQRPISNREDRRALSRLDRLRRLLR